MLWSKQISLKESVMFVINGYTSLLSCIDVRFRYPVHVKRHMEQVHREHKCSESCQSSANNSAKTLSEQDTLTHFLSQETSFSFECTELAVSGDGSLQDSSLSGDQYDEDDLGNGNQVIEDEVLDPALFLVHLTS